MRAVRSIAVVLVATSVAACASDPYSPTPKQDSGALTGALLGGLFGAAVGGRGADRIAGAAVGAIAGGLVGSAVGASMDEEDRRMAYAAEMQALENGAPGVAVGWRSERTRHYGNIVAGPHYETGGRRCRAYTHTIYVNGRPESARGTACRAPDGWVAMS